ncbi:hypothetical protein [Flavobacterium selenitireducens]|uniref:hypothetical protein n=1 Tax=Flavobacterium selenitireducens TaxID=2722704 RepID=UPI00168AA9E7|nr:hypothetical protein [Flavobacterium selenitireducens]MBD3584095.1 hypothetical protein [Flavobacterium selenitireducens]
MTEYINKLITIEFSDRKTLKTGFLIDFSCDWILLKSNPVDFVIDGFTIIRNKNIEAIYRDEDERFTEKVLRLKKLEPHENDKIPLDDIQTILNYINSKFGIFQFFKKSEKSIYPGRLKEINSKEIIIDWIDLKGIWSEERSFKLDKIRILEFDNDYLNSLKLVADSQINGFQ